MTTEARALEVGKDEIPVVSGVDQVYDEEGNVVEPGMATVTEVMKGEVQPDQFRDKPYAFLFIAQVIGVVATAVALAPKAFNSVDATTDDGAATTDDGDGNFGDAGGATGILFGAALCFIASVFLTLGALNMMTRHAESLVKISFFVAPGMFLLLAFLAIISGDDISFIFLGAAVLMSLVTVCCWFFYKKHVPFAASNLVTALSAIRVNYGLYLVGMMTSVVLWVWCVVWVIAIMGVVGKAGDKPKVRCSDIYDDDLVHGDENGMCDQPPNVIGMVILLFCFYWTQQVIQNVLHTTTAGTVGTWWFTPLGDSSICSEAVSSSLYRACTYSFGSICFGSMLVAILQTLEQLAKNARNNRRGGGILLCIVECLLYLLRAWLEYFNSWAFVYVGLYGYDYLAAGKNVMNLFKARGWTTLIADRLVFRVLLFCNLGIAALSGCIGLVIGAVLGAGMESAEDAAAMRMLMTIVALFTGIFTANAVLFVVESAVRTVIVCFAESPAEFQEHHPDLSEAMQRGWTEAYPTIYGVVV